MIVYFSCEACGLDMVGIDVPSRGQNDPKHRWVNKVGRLVRERHRELSPTCLKSELKLKIPCPEGTVWLGQEPDDVEKLHILNTQAGKAVFGEMPDNLIITGEKE